MIINNHHPDNISIIIGTKTYNLCAHSSVQVETQDVVLDCRIVHASAQMSDSEKVFDKVVKTISNITALWVDSSYILSDIQKDATLDISNDVLAYEKDDICLVLHQVVVKNAKIRLKNCYGANEKKLVHSRKLLLFGDAFDFPIVSLFTALYKFRRLKKIVSPKNLWEIVNTNTISVDENTNI